MSDELQLVTLFFNFIMLGIICYAIWLQRRMFRVQNSSLNSLQLWEQAADYFLKQYDERLTRVEQQLEILKGGMPIE